MSIRRTLQSVPAARLLATCALALVPTLCAAQSVRGATVTGISAIEAGAFEGATGMVSVNEAAGLNNVQANQAAIAVSPVGAADTNGAQAATGAARVPHAGTTIANGAFANVTGALMVNQAAGAANLQRNSVVLGAAAKGVETATDSELSAAVSVQGRLDGSIALHGAREVSIGNGAFANVSGIAQINQTAGAGNATANSFVLRPPAGTFF